MGCSNCEKGLPWVSQIRFDEWVREIREAVGCECEPYDGIQNEYTIRIPAANLRDVMGILKDRFDCYHLSAITAQQHEDRPEELEVIYHFWKGEGISFVMTLPLESLVIESITPDLPGADFYERELAELYGVSFSGREEIPPLLLPDDWNQPPPFLSKKD